MNAWKGRAAVFGKVQWHPEFLRGSPLSNDLHLFDEWLFRNGSALAPKEPAAPGEVASYGFLVHLEQPGDPRCCVAGVLEPSHDRAGRSYPLAVVASIALGVDVDKFPEVVPIVLEAYWDSALDVLAAIRSGPPADDRSLEDLTEPPLDDAADAYELYLDWTRGTEAQDFAEQIGRPASWLEPATRTIVDAISARGRVEGPRRLEAIRVPLGQAAGGALCFWLDVLRRAAGWRAHLPSFFWSFDGRSGEALLFLDRTKDSALSMLWRTTATADAVCDLTAPATETEESRVDSRRDDAAATREASQTLSALLEQVGIRSIARV